MPKSSATKALKDLTFEAAVSELEEIVSRLESGQIPLDEAMRLFERAKALLERCSKLLESAELKVRQLEGETERPPEEESE